MSNYNGQFQDSGANILLPTPHSYANIEGATASQAYVVGQMVVFNNRLCEVTSAISSGDTFTIGSNIAYKNVGDIGKQLVASDGKGFYFDVKDGKYGFYPSASKTASEFVPFGGSIDNLTISNPIKSTAHASSTWKGPSFTIPDTYVGKTIYVVGPMYPTQFGGYNDQTSGNVDTAHVSGCTVELVKKVINGSGRVDTALYKVTDIQSGAVFAALAQGNQEVVFTIICEE